MSDEITLNDDDKLLRRTEEDNIDRDKNIIHLEAFNHSSNDKVNGWRLSANCKRVLTENMNEENPFEFTLDGKSKEKYTVISFLKFDCDYCGLEVYLDFEFPANPSHCSINGWPKKENKTDRKKRRELRNCLSKRSRILDEC